MLDESGAKFVVAQLVDKFRELESKGKIARYNEEETKKDFILPLFKALGWDTENSTEVSAEEQISKGRVDYGFRINGIPKFFLEAKSLKTDLKNPKFIEQAINYAWLKGCTWAVLTNFKELIIYNAESSDISPVQSLFKRLYCTRFVEDFDDLSLLSRQSFEGNRLDKVAESWGKIIVRNPVDRQLLDDFTRFRDHLSRNIRRLNTGSNLTGEELDEAVQRLLDRLIFIRNCEDRGLEEVVLQSNYRQWKSKGKGHLLKELQKVFVYFNKQYNSKLFEPHLCDSLVIDNNVLAEIIQGLYSPKNKNYIYDFSAIEADVLGKIYEQYLSHILKTTGKSARLTEDFVHRKEQGIYYTPTYIVEFIVKNTLGVLLSKPDIEPEKIRVLDPACGSGSFLIKAYDLLKDYYSKNNSKNHNAFEIDYDTKVNILLNNIFGVDLDRQAVEIAQLNLLLKIAERGKQLPTLTNNIKCGDSLLDDPALGGDKALKWDEEFKEVFGSGGFDVIIGNPPYVPLSKNRGYLGNLYQSMNYEVFDSMGDIYCLFIERAMKLLKPNGYLGFIVSNKWMRAAYGEKLRKFLSRFNPLLIVDLGPGVFEDATVDTCILIVQKCENRNQLYGVKVEAKENFAEFIEENKVELPNFGKNKWLVSSNSELKLKEKIERIGKPLKNKDVWDVKVHRGILTGLNEVFIITTEKREEILANCNDEERKRTEAIIKPLLRGRNIKRYRYESADLWVIVIPAGWTNEKRGKEKPEIFTEKTFPSLMKYLKKFEKEAKQRKDQGDYWWELRHCSYYSEFEKEKIVWSGVGKNLESTIVPQKFFIISPANFLTGKNLYYLQGLLNSKLIVWYYEKIKTVLGNQGGRNYIYDFLNVPLPPITASNEAIAKQIEQFVVKMLDLHKRLAELSGKLTDERSRLQDEITRIDMEIDRLVYQLYDLTPEGITLIESR